MTVSRSLRPLLFVAALVATPMLLPSLGAQAQGTPPDIVRTNDGGFVRGTILEYRPGEEVVIQDAAGETTRIAGEAVVYAGSAANDPQAQSPAPPAVAAPQVAAPANTARVRLEGVGDEPLTFHLVTHTATSSRYNITVLGFDRLCTAPCEAVIPLGTQQLGLTDGGDQPAPGEAIEILPDMNLTGEYVDRTGLRIAGWLTFFGGIAVGTPIMLIPLFDDSSSSDFDYVPLVIGGAIMLTAGIIASILITRKDYAVFSAR